MNMYVLMSLHQAHLLLNNGVAKLAKPNTHYFPPACSVCCVYVLISLYVPPKRLHSSLIIINCISIKTYMYIGLHQIQVQTWVV